MTFGSSSRHKLDAKGEFERGKDPSCHFFHLVSKVREELSL